MTAQRILVDSQSLPSFIGKESEQDFDQRAGLCQGDKGDIVITTKPYEPAYLEYWQGLGYKIPHLVTAGPYDPHMALSDLIRTKEGVQSEIKSYLRENPRLEFFHGSARESRLAETLGSQMGIPSYMNFAFAEEFQRKDRFKNLFQVAGIESLPFLECFELKVPNWKSIENTLGKTSLGYIAKNVYGSGGKSLGMIVPLRNKDDYINLPLGNYIIEPCIEVSHEIAVHWEITFEGTIKKIGYFGQIASDLSYIGTHFPITIDQAIKRKLDRGFKKLTEEIRRRGGLGYMCCDVLVDKNSNIFWSDLNPRKGAIVFIHEAVARLKNIRSMRNVHVAHQHISGTNLRSFKETSQVLGSFIEPSRDFILITNPGAIRYGFLDITAISENSKECAMKLLRETKEVIHETLLASSRGREQGEVEVLKA